jgi:putative endonuclease
VFARERDKHFVSFRPSAASGEIITAKSQTRARMNKTYYVYILSSDSGKLYTGFSNDLLRRVWEHKQGYGSGYTRRYNIHRLVFFEETGDVFAAIEREKQIKRWRREKKLALIKEMNPKYEDLSKDWYDNE